MNTKCISILTLLAVGGVAAAASNIVAPASSEFIATDAMPGAWITGFEFTNGSAYAWADGAMKLIDGTTGATVTDFGAPVYEDAGGNPLTYYNSFVRIESATSVWVGFTTSGNSHDRIYQVDVSGPSGVWTQKAALTGVQDLAFSAGAAYAVGNPTAGAYGTDTTIYLLDLAAANDPNAHDEIATLGGYTAGLAMDAAGNLYYATNGLAADKLLRFSAGQLASAVGAGSLAVGDAEVLSALVGGAYDVEVDSAGNVLFNMNGAESLVARWNGVAADSHNYDILARGTAGGPHWFGMMDADGDCADSGGGTVYTGDFWNAGAGGVTIAGVLPEPGCLMLLAAGALAAVRRRR